MSIYYFDEAFLDKFKDKKKPDKHFKKKDESSSSNLMKVNIDGKSRDINFQGKFRKYDERKSIESSAISEIKAIIRNEEQIKKKIYNFILKEEGHDSDADEDAKTNAGYLDYFEVVEYKDSFAINAAMVNYQYMIYNLKNGRPTADTKVDYYD